MVFFHFPDVAFLSQAQNHAAAAVPRSQSPGFGLLCNILCQCDRFLRNVIYE